MPTPQRYVARDGSVTWRVRFRHQGRQTSESFPTQLAAKVFCDDVANHGADYAVRLLDVQDEERRSPTIGEVFEEFIEWKAPRVRSERTVADYRRDYANSIGPTFGGARLASVTESDIQAWVSMLGRTLSPKTVAGRHALLHAVFVYAMHPARAYVAHNPTLVTELPVRPKARPRGLRPAEWAAISAALRQLDDNAADLARFLLASGWRWSEATALDTHGVEIGWDESVHVTMQQVVRRGKTRGETAIVADGKTEAAYRRILLDGQTAAMVARRADAAPAGGLIFTNRRGNRWNYDNFRRQYWLPALGVANIKRRVTPHELRHSSVFWLLMGGKATLPEIQKRIGHQSPATTVGVYGSLLADVRPEALDVFTASDQPPVGSIGS